MDGWIVAGTGADDAEERPFELTATHLATCKHNHTGMTVVDRAPALGIPRDSKTVVTLLDQLRALGGRADDSGAAAGAVGAGDDKDEEEYVEEAADEDDPAGASAALANVNRKRRVTYTEQVSVMGCDEWLW
jgi:hypothetical protein